MYNKKKKIPNKLSNNPEVVHTLCTSNFLIVRGFSKHYDYIIIPIGEIVSKQKVFILWRELENLNWFIIVFASESFDFAMNDDERFVQTAKSKWKIVLKIEIWFPLFAVSDIEHWTIQKLHVHRQMLLFAHSLIF